LDIFSKFKLNHSENSNEPSDHVVEPKSHIDLPKECKFPRDLSLDNIISRIEKIVYTRPSSNKFCILWLLSHKLDQKNV